MAVQRNLAHFRGVYLHPGHRGSMEEQKRRVVAAFDLASDTYDAPALRCLDLHARTLVQQAQVAAGARVLDVATGTGKVAFEAARAVGPQGRVTGVDISEGMLAQARRKAGAAPVEFRQMDAENLEFVDATFDVVLCGFGIFFLPNMVRGVHEMRRVLRPGGRVVLSTWTMQAFEPMAEMMRNRTKRYGLPVPPAPPEPWMELTEPGHMQTLLAAGGFRDAQVVVEPAGYFIEPEDWWTFMWGTASRGRLRQLAPDALAHFREESLEEVRRLRSDRGIWLEASAVIGVGVRERA